MVSQAETNIKKVITGLTVHGLRTMLCADGNAISIQFTLKQRWMIAAIVEDTFLTGHPVSMKQMKYPTIRICSNGKMSSVFVNSTGHKN